MTLLYEAGKDKKFDVRVIEKHLNRGIVTQTELTKLLASLPDDSANAEWVTLESIKKSGDEGAVSNGSGHP